jgi:DNA/RNA endonuclease YhcR with UshA esterase domain
MKKTILVIIVAHSFANAISQRKTITENFLSNVGDSVVVTGKIYNGAYLIHVNTKPTFLNLGDTSPSHRLILRIEPEDRDKFPSPPETYFLNKIVTVTGKLQEYKGAPLIQISEPGMIKTETDSVSTINLFNNNFTETGKPIAPITQRLEAIKPDTVLQSAWIKSVTQKAAEEKTRNVRIVQKPITLRTAPYSDAPAIAELVPGMVVSVLYTSKKWSYISIGSIEGFNNVNGFIRHKRFKYLKKVPTDQ